MITRILKSLLDGLIATVKCEDEMTDNIDQITVNLRNHLRNRYGEDQALLIAENIANGLRKNIPDNDVSCLITEE